MEPSVALLTHRDEVVGVVISSVGSGDDVVNMLGGTGATDTGSSITHENGFAVLLLQLPSTRGESVDARRGNNYLGGERVTHDGVDVRG